MNNGYEMSSLTVVESTKNFLDASEALDRPEEHACIVYTEHTVFLPKLVQRRVFLII